MQQQKIGRRKFIGNGATLAAAATLSRFASPALWAAPTDAGSQLQALLGKMHPSGAERGGGPDSTLSAEWFAQELHNTKAQLQQLKAIDLKQLGKDECIDYRYAESILRGKELAQETMLRWKKDPRIYLQLGSLSALISRPAPDNDRAQQVIALLKSVPPRLANGEKNIEVCIPRFRELSLFMIDNTLPIFRDDVPRFADQVPNAKADILRGNTACLAAVTEYRRFVSDALPTRPKADFSIGPFAYDAMLKDQYLLNYNADTLYAFAWEQFNSTVKELEAVAKSIDPSKPWLQVAAKIKEDGPEPLKMIEAHQMWVNKARVHVIDKALVPIPWKERVDVVPRAEYLRKTSYYGNFSMARRPDNDGVLVGQWQINTFLPSWSEEEKRQYMVEHDWGVIIDTAPHETYCGHHVQGLYQLHNPNKFRRVSSISIFSEGWGLYVERLMQETGFFPGEGIHLRQLQLRLWRIARVIWDVGMNTGKLTYDAAVSLLVDRVGFQKWAAELEVDYAAEHPGYQLGYFMGYSEIIRMREEFRKVRGAQFTFSDFHERLLKVGCMPPTLMREGLMNSLV